MDDAIRSLERRLRAGGGDLALAREYRRALERQGDHDRASWQLDALEGALCVRSATGVQADPGMDPPPRWERVAVGGQAPALAPQGPGAAPLTVRWRAPGRARWVSASVVLLEQADRALEARCTRTGRALWTVAAIGPGHPRGLIQHDTERTTVLGWAVAPWGAVALTARFEARLARPRRGSASWRPRETEREVLERGPARVEATLQVLVAPGGAWGAEAPQEVVARASAHERLGDGDLVLEGWDDDLLCLALDAEAPRFAVRWRDQEQDWAVFEVGLGDDGAAWVGPAPWSAAADEDPVGRIAAEDADRAVARRGDGEAARLPLDAGALVRTRDDDGLDALWVASDDGARAARPLPADLEPLLADLELRLWSEAPVEPPDAPPRAAVVLPVHDLLVVQAGDVVAAVGAPS